MRALRDRFEAGLADLPGAQIFGAGTARLPNTVQFVIPGWEGEALLMALDRRGIGVSSGSACASGRGEPSHVLLAMGIERDLAYGAVRVSLGKDSSEADVDRMLAALGALHPMSSAA
jgi:cysteine desulfurase